MPSITLTLPSAGTKITAGLHATNYAALQALLNGGLDSNNVTTDIVTKPSGILSGEAAVWNGSAWVRSSATKISPGSLGTGTPDSTKFLRGDSSWETITPYSPPSAKAAFGNHAGGVPLSPGWHTLDWGELVDTDAIMDPGTPSRFTCKTAGVYFIFGHLMQDPTDAAMGGRILLNSSSEIMRDHYEYTHSHASAKLAALYTLAVNDYVEFQMLNHSSVGNSSIFSYAGMFKLA